MVLLSIPTGHVESRKMVQMNLFPTDSDAEDGHMGARGEKGRVGQTERSGWTQIHCHA